MFVAGNEVVAVCQRHVDTKFEHLAGKGSHYGSKLVDWWEGVVAEHAPLNDCALRGQCLRHTLPPPSCPPSTPHRRLGRVH